MVLSVAEEDDVKVIQSFRCHSTLVTLTSLLQGDFPPSRKKSAASVYKQALQRVLSKGGCCKINGHETWPFALPHSCELRFAALRNHLKPTPPFLRKIKLQCPTHRMLFLNKQFGDSSSGVRVEHRLGSKDRGWRRCCEDLPRTQQSVSTHRASRAVEPG